MKRIFLFVLDSCGIGQMPDSRSFGDVGVNTLASCAATGILNIPNLTKAGLGNIDGVSCVSAEGNPTGAYARLAEKSMGKDTTIGHWEIAGLVSPDPLPTYPQGFPEEVLAPFRAATGRGVLANAPWSGTAVIEEFGEEHMKTGDLIVYTSADSVFQIAAHEDIVPPEKLYEYCRIARNILQGKHGVGRVIARPFVGTPGNFKRTSNRHDFSLEPSKDTLLDVLDFTHTAMGTRLLKKWLEYPLMNIGKINQRLDSVEELAGDFLMRQQLQAACKSIYDFERLLTRIEVGSANARDLAALRTSFMALPGIHAALAGAKSRLLQKCREGIHLYEDFVDLLQRAIVDEPGLTIRDGGIIRDGYNEELDQYRLISRDSRQLLQQMEEQEKEKTGIRFLKIGYNKVFGYYIEVRNSGADKVPPHYVRKQTLANAERYITEELKEFETKILGAQEKIVSIEYNLFVEIRDAIKEKLGDIQATAREIARLDVLTGLAEAAASYNYVRPRLANNGQLDIKDGRHPLVERILQRDLFVPNDTRLNHDDCEIMLITGPNMAGKSTYMRQTALLVLMAQIGSFIPAREAVIAPVDRIFTRIGASDDLVSGQSTFMVEMNEVAQILKYATSDSLVILDEIGRGTSTFDGMSIARAVIEHIREKVHAKTLFATHYHELTDLEDDKIRNFCIAVKEKGRDITFLRRIIAGAADKSYGIHVARLAGLPKAVTGRAEKILATLEKGAAAPQMAEAAPDVRAVRDMGAGSAENVKPAKTVKPVKPVKPVKESADMGSLFASSLSDDLLKLDVMTMTPLEAMNELYRLQQQAKKEAGLG